MTKKKLLTILGIFLLLTVAVILFYPPLAISLFPSRHKEEESIEALRKKADEWLQSVEGASSSTKIALIGEEYIFQEDLDYIIYETYQGSLSVDPRNALDALFESSIILQEASDMGALTLTTDYFNNPFKDQKLRSSMINEARSFIEDEVVQSMKYDLITVWFYNQYPGKTFREQGIELAKTIAYEKISQMYEKVRTGILTKDEAGAELSKDQSVIDLSTKGQVEQNSYLSSLSTSNPQEIFPYNAEYGERLKKLKAGKYSDILLAKDRPGVEGDNPKTSIPSDRIIDAYYGFIYVLENDGSYSTYDEWLSDMLNIYPTEKYD